MKFELKTISYWPLIKISFVINLVFGFIMGIFFALFIGMIFSLATKLGGLSGMPTMQGELPPLGLILLIYPFMFGFGGAFVNTIAALILAFIYNLVAKGIGGLEFEMNQVMLQPVSVMAQPQGYYVAIPPQSPQTSPPPPPPIQPLPPDITPPPENSGQN
jgi:hypothetical protein